MKNTRILMSLAFTSILIGGCVAEDIADEEIASCKNGHTFSISSNDPDTTIFKKLRLNSSEVYDTEKGLVSKIGLYPEEGGQGTRAELAVGESFTVENIGKFTLIRAREEPDFIFFRSPSDNVDICFEPDPNFTYDPQAN